MRAPTVRIFSMLLPGREPGSCPTISWSVEFASVTVPSSENERNPHGSVSRMVSMGRPSGRSSSGRAKVLPDQADRLVWMTHVRAVPRGLHHPERAAAEVSVEVLADLERGDHVFGALEDETRDGDVLEVFPIVREERDL